MKKFCKRMVCYITHSKKKFISANEYEFFSPLWVDILKVSFNFHGKVKIGVYTGLKISKGRIR